MDAATAIMGNTVIGIRDGKKFNDYYAPDGKAVALERGDVETGNWSIEGDSFCTDYPSEGKLCFRLEVVGETITFLGPEGAGYRGTIKPGNPGNL